jgi:hypothetical protein
MKTTATFNRVLTSVFNAYYASAEGYVGLRLAPLFRTAEQTATYPVFKKENFLNFPRLRQRAPGTPFQRSTAGISDDMYSCRNYGHETPVADEDRKKYASILDADKSAISRNAEVILINHELRVRDKLLESLLPRATPGALWDDYADSDPIGDVKAAISAVEDACGLRPTTITLSQRIADKLSAHPKIRSYFPTHNGPMTNEMLRVVFGIDRMLIAGAKENTAAEGQPLSVGHLWGKDVFLTVTNEGQNLELPNVARTMLWTAPGESGGGEAGSYIETYRDDSIKSDVHRSLHHTDEKITGADFGYILTGVIG